MIQINLTIPDFSPLYAINHKTLVSHPNFYLGEERDFLCFSNINVLIFDKQNYVVKHHYNSLLSLSNGSKNRNELKHMLFSSPVPGKFFFGNNLKGLTPEKEKEPLK